MRCVRRPVFCSRQRSARRESLGLTQKQLADFLLISDSTLSRWETGGQIQQKSLDRLLRAFFALEEFREYVGAPIRGAHESLGSIPQPIDHGVVPETPATQTLRDSSPLPGTTESPNRPVPPNPGLRCAA